MKAGGVHGAVRLAAYAEAAGIDLMWAARTRADRHRRRPAVALASPRTRYLDLDGSFDLARDVVDGGFVLADGVLRTTGAPGLGVSLRPSARQNHRRRTAPVVRAGAHVVPASAGAGQSA